MSHLPGCPSNGSLYAPCTCDQIRIAEHTDALNRNTEVVRDELSDTREYIASLEAELATLRALCVRQTDALKGASFLGYLCDEGGKAIPRDSVEYKDIHDGIQKALKLTPADLHDCVTVKRNVWESTQKMTEDAQKIATALIERVGNLEAELLKEIQANASLTEDLSVARLVTGTTSSYDDLLSRFKKYSATMESERTALRQQNAELVAAMESVKRDSWDMKALNDLYYIHGGAPLVDFLLDYVLSEFDKSLGGKGWTAYESDGGLDDGINYEINSLLDKNTAIDSWDHRPLGPLLMGLIRLTDEESNNGKWSVELNYDNHNDGARVFDGDGKLIAESYEDREGPDDGDGADAQFVDAIFKALASRGEQAKAAEGGKL